VTGGRLVEKWVAVPELDLDVQSLGHSQDAWAGILNLPATLLVPSAGRRIQSASRAAADPALTSESVATRG
jgi:hypothetical protein